MEKKFFRVKYRNNGFPPQSILKKYNEASLFDANGHYEITIYDWSYAYTLQVEHEKLPLVPDWFMVSAYIGKENIEILKKIGEIASTAPYTRESIQYTFRKYPNISQLVGVWNELKLGIQGIELFEDSIVKRYICFSSDFLPSGYKEKTSGFIEFVNGILNELEGEIYINTSDLVINTALVGAVNGIRDIWSNTPNWVKTALAVGGVIAIKAIVRDACMDGLNFGNDNNSLAGSDFGGSDYDGSDFGGLDFDGSDFDGSDFDGLDFNGSDFGGSDFDGLDFDGSDYDGSDYEQGYNVPFGANRTVGGDTYLEKGTITLERAGGGSGDKEVTVYVKSGTNTRYILDGNTPRKIDGIKFTVYNGIKYFIK